jgi:MerR family mercuric resistance operon transcriptional regulator
MEDTLRMGELAASVGLSRETLRYYERIGLLPEPDRSTSGYRQYPREAVGRLKFIGRAQELGFTLAEIEELLGLRVDNVAACDRVCEHAAAKLESVEAKVADLKRIASSLSALIDQCESRETTVECPILEALERGP